MNNLKTVNCVIVEIDDLYNNTEDKIIINDSIENVENINREAKVISAPSFTILKSGDKIIAHHNIFRKKYNTDGHQINSNFWIEDNKYFVPLTEIFMYNRDSEWKAISPFCFIKPIKMNQSDLGFNLSDNTYKGNIKNIGIVEYSNPDLEQINIIKGTKVLFSKNSEYEFKIDNQIYYKMITKDILGIVDERII